MAERLGDGPIQPELHDVMNALAHGLDDALNGEVRGKERKVGFVLLTFPFGSTDGRTNFISNGADRRDLVVMFKELVARFEGQPELKGRA